jgi:hypothetical protein
MKIVLKNLKQEIFEIEIEEEANTKRLKDLIQEKFHFDAEKIKLLFNGSVLNIQNEKLSEKGIGEGSIMIMMNMKKIESNKVESKLEQKAESNTDLKVDLEFHGELEKKSETETNTKDDLDLYDEPDIPKNENAVQNNENEEIEEEEKVYEADLKPENAIQTIASIIKIACLNDPERGPEILKQFQNDNPSLKTLLLRNQDHFKSLLYSPKTKEDEEIFKKFYHGQMKNNSEPSTSEHRSRSKEELSETDKSNITTMVEMGYPEKAVKEIYFACGKDITKAINYLLNNGI